MIHNLAPELSGRASNDKHDCLLGGCAACPHRDAGKMAVSIIGDYAPILEYSVLHAEQWIF